MGGSASECKRSAGTTLSGVSSWPLPRRLGVKTSPGSVSSRSAATARYLLLRLSPSASRLKHTMAGRRTKESVKVNAPPPGSSVGIFVTGGMPQQYVHDTTANTYKNTPLALLGPNWDQLLSEARSLSSAGQHAIAIIIAAAAGEWATEFVLERLMDTAKDHSKSVRDLVEMSERLLVTWSFEADRVRKAFHDLTGENPDRQSWWGDWMWSRRQRHDIAHRGVLTANATAAKKCIDVAALHIAYLTEVVKRRGP
jgi:hypothetical protein